MMDLCLWNIQKKGAAFFKNVATANMQEDNVEYHIYSTTTPWNVEQDIIKFEQTVAPLIEGYIWQHDPFKRVECDDQPQDSAS